MSKRKWILAGALLLSGLLLSVGVATAFLTDVEVMDNVITIGSVSVALSEDFTPAVVVPGSLETKAPKLTNNGAKDEYVFLRVTVPKAEVTLLYEADEYDDAEPPQLLHRKGTPRAEQQAQELFRFLADSTGGDGSPLATAAFTGPCDGDLTYHSIPAEGPDPAGWLLLESDTSDGETDVYYFGYNKKLTPEAETRTLFDQIQLKSFIDGEVQGEVAIGVFGYGIQADNLKPEGTELTPADLLTEAQLRSVWTIVRNKLKASGVIQDPPSPEP